MLRRLLITVGLALAAVSTAAVPATSATAGTPTGATAPAIAAEGPCPYSSQLGHPEIRQGSGQQAAVRHLQCLLRNVWGYTSVGIDSSFGPITRSAVIAHQNDCGITPDGIVGPQTWTRLHPDTTTAACRD